MKYTKILTLLKYIIDNINNTNNIIEKATELYDIYNNNINENIYFNIIDILWNFTYNNDKEYIMEFQTGSGGVDANDWTQMLFNMYTKYFNKKNVKYIICDINQIEGGIRSAMIKFTSKEGLFLSENGIHRLVRISPFNKNSKRHTSFSSVRIYNFIEDSNIEILSKDLEIDTFRSSGAGGQHVNTTDSAVRIKHIPSGIIVKCQNERSQFQNKEIALKILKRKLILLEEAKKLKNNDYNNLLEISWGSHFRSYVLDPYKLIKDERLNIDIKSDVIVQNTLNGDIEYLIKEYQYSILFDKYKI